jgi:hypothetical protein
MVCPLDSWGVVSLLILLCPVACLQVPPQPTGQPKEAVLLRRQHSFEAVLLLREQYS